MMMDVMSKTVTVIAAAILGGTLLASAANAASTPQITGISAGHNIYCGHMNTAATNPEQKGFMYAGRNMYAGQKASVVYAGHKTSAAAPHGYNDAPGNHALGGGPG